MIVLVIYGCLLVAMIGVAMWLDARRRARRRITDSVALSEETLS